MRKFAVVAVLMMAAVSCGKGHDAAVQVDTNVDARALSAAADHTTSAGTGKVHLTTTEQFAGQTGGDPFGSTVGDGTYDAARGLSSMTMSIQLPQAFAAGLPFGSEPTGTNLATSLQPLDQIIQHGQTLYVKVLRPFFGTQSDKWVTVDLDRMRAAGSTDFAMTPLQGWNPMGDPTTILAYLKGAGADVTTVGHETINDIDTTHFHATLSLQQAIDAAGSDGANVAQTLKDLRARALTDTTIPVDVYIDADRYVRRVTLTYDTGLTDGSPDTTVGSMNSVSWTTTLTADYSDFGQPVTISEPPADQTTTMCDAAAAAGATDPQDTVPPGLC